MRDRGRMWARRAAILIAAGVLLAGNLGFFLWYRATARDRKVGLEERRAALEREVGAIESEATKLTGDRRRLSEVRSALDEFYSHRVGARRETLAAVVEELHTVLKRVGVSPGEISYATSAIANPPLSQMLISFGFKGDYNKFKQLLAAFETDRKWIAVREIGLNRDQDMPGSVQVHITLVTYFAVEEGETARASLPGGARP